MFERQAEDFIPDWFSKPADSLLGIARRRCIAVEEVAEGLDGGMDTMRNLVRGTRAIDASLAQAISAVVGGSPEFWLRRQQNYEKALDLVLRDALAEMDEWLQRVPSPSSKSGGKLSELQKQTELRERLSFYGVNNLRTWYSQYSAMRGTTQFRTSGAFASKAGDVSLWLRQGELEAALTTTRSWNPSKLRSLLNDMLALSKIRQPERFLPKLKALGAEAGVAIVVMGTPDGCKASGASRLVHPDKALVMLSFRHRTDDHFWFTLMHECAHLLLHGAASFVDTDGTHEDDLEVEANEFAHSCIIPAARWDEFANIRHDRNSILRFSTSLGIAPGLVVGQLQHRSAIPRSHLNYLKRRWTWPEIDAAIVNL